MCVLFIYYKRYVYGISAANTRTFRKSNETNEHGRSVYAKQDKKIKSTKYNNKVTLQCPNDLAQRAINTFLQSIKLGAIAVAAPPPPPPSTVTMVAVRTTAPAAAARV